MPELPEVESLRLSLLPFVLGKTILSIQVNKPQLVAGTGNLRKVLTFKKEEFENSLQNETIQSIDRRAKNLIFHFSSGKVMLVHLKMTGQLVYSDTSTQISGGHPIQISQNSLPHKHTHIIFSLDQGTLYYNDIRQFGYLLYFNNFTSLQNSNHFANLGLEPFDPDFTLKYFQTALKHKKSVLKSVLLNQAVVVGLGNIYCDEVCFYAKVLPTRLASSLKPSEVKRLYQGIKDILTHAISLGGSSIANYLLADGSRGNFAREHQVYGRAGLPCYRCGTILLSTKINSRTTVFCPKCQK